MTKGLPCIPARCWLKAAIALWCSLATSMSSSETLSWEDCIRLATQQNAELEAARASLLAAELSEKAMRGAYLPQVSSSIKSNYAEVRTDGASNSNQSNFSGSNSRRGSSNSAGLSVTQPLFTGFKTDAQVAEAVAARSVSLLNLETTKAKVSFDLKNAAANLWYSQVYITLSEGINKRREENLRLVELRFESGLENKGSLLLSRASLSDARFDRKQAQDSAVVAQSQLARALGQRDGPELMLSDSVPESLPVRPTDFSALLPQTLERRLAVAEQERAQAQVQFARSRLYPLLDLTGDLALQRGSVAADRDNYTVGLSLSFPIFSGGTDYANYQSARATFLSAQSALRNIEQQQLVKLKQAFTSFDQAVERERVGGEFVEAVRVRADISRSKYNNGLLTFENWDIIENDLINRQKTHLLTRRDRVTAEAAWEQALGKGVLP